MGGPLDYSTTATSNTTVGGVSIAEGMQAGKTNDGMRAMMADTRKWQLDWSGVVTAGTGDAYTITSNQGISAYADGMRFSFRADRNNTGAATLNVDSRGAKALRRMDGSSAVALVSGDLVAGGVYDVVYVLADDIFVVVNSFGNLPGLTATITELNYVDGVTSAIQTQLDGKQALDADLTAISALTGTGILARTGAGTYAERTITSTGGTVTITNPGGVAGNINLEAASAFTFQSPVATTSGTTVNISTSIPATVREICLYFNGVSFAGSANLFVQLGDAGGFETTGYNSSSAAGGADTDTTSGFIVRLTNAARALVGRMDLITVGGNIWVESHAMKSGALSAYGGGDKTLSDTLTQLRVTSSDGADTFDAGAITIGWR